MNSMYFSKEMVKAGEMSALLDTLTKQSYGAGNFYNDIHIKPEDCGAFIVEWEQIPWDHTYGGSFQFIEEEQIVMLEKLFPDNHYEYCLDEEDYNERLEEWLKENPGWVKTSYGTWTNEIENTEFIKQFWSAADSNSTNDLKVESKKDFEIDSDFLENGIPQ